MPTVAPPLSFSHCKTPHVRCDGRLKVQSSPLPSAIAGPVPDAEEKAKPHNTPDRLCTTLYRKWRV